MKAHAAIVMAIWMLGTFWVATADSMAPSLAKAVFYVR